MVDGFSESPERLTPGQIAWVPTLIPRHLPWVLDVRRRTPRGHDNVQYEIREMGQRDFAKKRDRLPIHRIRLLPTEELLAIKAKKRPCIMISQYLPKLHEDQIQKITKSKPHLLQNEQIFLPIYSVAGEDSPSGFPPGLVKIIRRAIYSHLLYFPATKTSGHKDRFNDRIKEGVVRIDRIFFHYSPP